MTITNTAPIASIAAASITALASAGTLFVDSNTPAAPNAQDGATPATAFADLQSALTFADPGDSILVAEGTYRPTTGTNRVATFNIPPGIKVRGGFPSGFPVGAIPAPLTHVTTLSGEIGSPGNDDNSFHVVRLANSDSLLSGFHITGGHADGGVADSLGAGITVTGSATIAHCVIYGNESASAGSALSAAGAGSVELQQCVVLGNLGATGGPALDFQFCSPRLLHCLVTRNIGGGMRCINTVSPSLVANSILRGNSGLGTPLQQQFHLVNASVTVVGSNITGGASIGTSNFDADPKFIDEAGPDGSIATADDRHLLRGDSPCIDRGASTSIPTDLGDIDGDGSTTEPLPLDLAGTQRRIDDSLVTAVGPGAGPHPDSGPYEYARPRTIVVDRDATGANNGRTWLEAYTSLESAIAELKASGTGGPGEIWIAKGTYVPTAMVAGAPTFAPGPGTRLLGGFAGGELTRAARDPHLHRTILSGDAGLPGLLGNSRHVVTFTGSSIGSSTMLDGCEIRDGVTANNEIGGGVLISGSQPTIRNCVFTANSGSSLGAAIGIVSTQQPGPAIVQCLVVGNSASGSGSPGIFINSGSARLQNTLVAANASPNTTHGALGATASFVTVQNSLLVGNTNPSGAPFAAQATSLGASIQLLHSAVTALPSGQTSGFQKINAFAVGADGGLVDPTGPDGIVGTGDEDLRPSPCGGLVDAGTTDGLPGDPFDLDEDGDLGELLTSDFVGTARVIDLPEPNVLSGSVGSIDIGPVERTGGSSSLAGPNPDLNGDGAVDAIDLGLLLGAWNDTSPLDLTGDCVVDAADLATLLGGWG